MIESLSLVLLDDLDLNSKVMLPLVLGLVVGGLVLVYVMTVVLLWIIKIRKQNLVENSNWLPIQTASEGSSHRSLTARIATQGSPLPNINLRLKISLRRRVSMQIG